MTTCDSGGERAGGVEGGEDAADVLGAHGAGEGAETLGKAGGSGSASGSGGHGEGGEGLIADSGRGGASHVLADRNAGVEDGTSDGIGGVGGNGGHESVHVGIDHGSVSSLVGVEGLSELGNNGVGVVHVSNVGLDEAVDSSIDHGLLVKSSVDKHVAELLGNEVSLLVALTSTSQKGGKTLLDSSGLIPLDSAHEVSNTGADVGNVLPVLSSRVDKTVHAILNGIHRVGGSSAEVGADLLSHVGNSLRVNTVVDQQRGDLSIGEHGDSTTKLRDSRHGRDAINIRGLSISGNLGNSVGHGSSKASNGTRDLSVLKSTKAGDTLDGADGSGKTGGQGGGLRKGDSNLRHGNRDIGKSYIDLRKLSDGVKGRSHGEDTLNSSVLSDGLRNVLINLNVVHSSSSKGGSHLGEASSGGPSRGDGGNVAGVAIGTKLRGGTVADRELRGSEADAGAQGGSNVAGGADLGSNVGAGGVGGGGSNKAGADLGGHEAGGHGGSHVAGGGNLRSNKAGGGGDLRSSDEAGGNGGSHVAGRGDLGHGVAHGGGDIAGDHRGGNGGGSGVDDLLPGAAPGGRRHGGGLDEFDGVDHADAVQSVAAHGQEEGAEALGDEVDIVAILTDGSKEAVHAVEGLPSTPADRGEELGQTLSNAVGIGTVGSNNREHTLKSSLDGGAALGTADGIQELAETLGHGNTGLAVDGNGHEDALQTPLENKALGEANVAEDPGESLGNVGLLLKPPPLADGDKEAVNTLGEGTGSSGGEGLEKVAESLADDVSTLAVPANGGEKSIHTPSNSRPPVPADGGKHDIHTLGNGITPRAILANGGNEGLEALEDVLAPTMAKSGEEGAKALSNLPSIGLTLANREEGNSETLADSILRVGTGGGKNPAESLGNNLGPPGLAEHSKDLLEATGNGELPFLSNGAEDASKTQGHGIDILALLSHGGQEGVEALGDGDLSVEAPGITLLLLLLLDDLALGMPLLLHDDHLLLHDALAAAVDVPVAAVVVPAVVVPVVPVVVVVMMVVVPVVVMPVVVVPVVVVVMVMVVVAAVVVVAVAGMVAPVALGAVVVVVTMAAMLGDVAVTAAVTVVMPSVAVMAP